MREWYVRVDDADPVGPVSTELLVRGIVGGKISDEALVVEVGAGAWGPIKAIKAFNEAFKLHGVPQPPDRLAALCSEGSDETRMYVQPAGAAVQPSPVALPASNLPELPLPPSPAPSSSPWVPTGSEQRPSWITPPTMKRTAPPRTALRLMVGGLSLCLVIVAVLVVREIRAHRAAERALAVKDCAELAQQTLRAGNEVGGEHAFANADEARAFLQKMRSVVESVRKTAARCGEAGNSDLADLLLEEQRRREREIKEMETGIDAFAKREGDQPSSPPSGAIARQRPISGRFDSLECERCQNFQCNFPCDPFGGDTEICGSCVREPSGALKDERECFECVHAHCWECGGLGVKVVW